MSNKHYRLWHLLHRLSKYLICLSNCLGDVPFRLRILFRFIDLSLCEELNWGSKSRLLLSTSSGIVFSPTTATGSLVFPFFVELFIIVSFLLLPLSSLTLWSSTSSVKFIIDPCCGGNPTLLALKMLLLSSLQLLTSVVLLSLPILLLVPVHMLTFMSLLDAPKGRASSQSEPSQIRNKSSKYRSTILALPLLLPAKYFGSFFSILWFFRAFFGILFWLNPLEILIHLRKHQNLMTLVQNMMVGIHTCETFLFWLSHTAELCLHWGLIREFHFRVVVCLTSYQIFYFLFFIRPKPCTGSNIILAASVTVSKVNINVFTSFRTHVYLCKSTHAHVQVIFNPQLKFQLGYRKPGWKFQSPGQIQP